MVARSMTSTAAHRLSGVGQRRRQGTAASSSRAVAARPDLRDHAVRRGIGHAEADVFAAVVVCGLGLPAAANAPDAMPRKHLRKDFNIEVSVCVTDAKRDLIVLVKSLDKRRKVVVVDCAVDLTPLGGGKLRTKPAALNVSEYRPNNRHVIAAHIPDHLAAGFRSLDTDRIQCRYYSKLLEQQA